MVLYFGAINLNLRERREGERERERERKRNKKAKKIQHKFLMKSKILFQQSTMLSSTNAA